MAASLPVAERTLDFSAHLIGTEIAPDTEDDIFGLEVLPVEVDEVVARYRIDRPVFGDVAVCRILAVDDAVELAKGDGRSIVVAPGDTISLTDLRQFDLVAGKSRITQNIGDRCKTALRVLFEYGNGSPCDVAFDECFDDCAQAVEFFVELIAVVHRGPARSHHGCGDGRKSRFVHRLPA